MDDTALSKYTISFGLSLALCSVLNALLVVLKETSRTVVAELQKITGYQWVTHVAVVLVLFALFGWLFSLANHGQGLKVPAGRLTGIVVAGVVAGGLIITGFYFITGFYLFAG